MINGINEIDRGTENEDLLAKQYVELVETDLNQIECYLKFDKVDKHDIILRMQTVQDLYARLFHIQYEISQISPQKVLEYEKKDDTRRRQVYAYVIDAQAKNWLNRLSTILNVLTIKLSKFDELGAKRREIFYCCFSIIMSALISLIFTWMFDVSNDKYLENNIEKRIINQESVINLMQQEHRLDFNILKEQNNQLNTVIELDKKIIEDQNDKKK